MSPQESTLPPLRPPGEGFTSQAQSEQGKRKLAGLDLQALAELILRLIKEEARLELERQGRRR